MMSGPVVLLAALFAFVVTAGGVAAFRQCAHSRQLLDLPNARSSHREPTPRGAGVVIFTVTGVSLGVGYALGYVPITSYGLAVSGGAFAVAAISLLDDIRGVSSLVRLGVHAGAGAVVVFAWGDLGSWSTGWVLLARLLAVFWVVGLTNVYNFMDGVDGLAGGQAVLTGATIACVAWQAGAVGTGFVSAVLAGATGGFLLHNWAPARVFLGDVGSAFLGFVFAALILGMLPDYPRAATAAFVSLWLFVFDAATTLLRRAFKGENVLSPHRAHLYQRIVIAGLSHAMVASGYVAAGAFAALLSIRWAVDEDTPGVVLAAPAVLAILLWLVVVRVERHKRVTAGESQK